MALAITLTVAFALFMIALGIAVRHFTRDDGFYGF